MKKWEKKELSDSKIFEGRRVRGSGNQWNRPGDIISEKFLIDSKQTDNKSYSLTLENLQKLYHEGLFAYRIPMFSIKIQETEVVVLFKGDFVKLLQAPTMP